MTECTEAIFWQDLRQQLVEDELAERRMLAEAEQLLAELDLQAVEPLAPARIEAITADVLTADAEAERAATTDKGRTSGGRVVPFRRVRQGVAAAAAIVVAPKFLIAATAVTTLAVTTTIVLKNTLYTLPYQDAIELMTDESLPGKTRRTAEGRAYNRMHESITLLKQIAATTGAVANGANSQLERIRAELNATTAFQLASFPQGHRSLAERVAAAELSPAAKLRAMQRLADQVVYGVRALRSVRDRGGPAVLMRANAAHLFIIERLLEE